MSKDIPELSNLAKSFKPGIYRHFKGGVYEALFIARDTEAPEKELVVYRSLEKGYIWTRPLEMFMENIERDDYQGPRFTWLRERD